MTFSSAIVACFLFSVCFSHSSASVIPNEKMVDHGIRPKAYNLHVTERGTKFTERIIIDEDKHLEYFHVPAHNQVTEAADYLYDFKNYRNRKTWELEPWLCATNLNLELYGIQEINNGLHLPRKYARIVSCNHHPLMLHFKCPKKNGPNYSNMAVQRIDSRSVCFLGPLPEKLLNPRNLKAVLDKVSHAPPPVDEIIFNNYWIIAEQVDKNLLREEVQKFCENFPIYRRQKVELNSTNNHIHGERTRMARVPIHEMNNFPPFCEKKFPTGCNPEKWLYDYKIRSRTCTYWLTCKFDIFNKIDCDTLKSWNHEYNSIICYSPRCP